MVIYSGFTHWKWWFSIVMLVYQRVSRTCCWLNDFEFSGLTEKTWKKYERIACGDLKRGRWCRQAKSRSQLPPFPLIGVTLDSASYQIWGTSNVWKYDGKYIKMYQITWKYMSFIRSGAAPFQILRSCRWAFPLPNRHPTIRITGCRTYRPPQFIGTLKNTNSSYKAIVENGWKWMKYPKKSHDWSSISHANSHQIAIKWTLSWHPLLDQAIRMYPHLHPAELDSSIGARGAHLQQDPRGVRWHHFELASLWSTPIPQMLV